MSPVSQPSILLFEDDPDMRRVLADVFVDEGLPVRACSTPDEVRRGRRDGEVALAVVDAWGESLTVLSEAEREEIRSLAAAVPTIMLTARLWAASTSAADLGLLALLRKPFDLDALVWTVRSSITRLLVESSRARAGARRLRSELEDAHDALQQASRRLDALSRQAGRAARSLSHRDDGAIVPSGGDARCLLRALQRLLTMDVADVETALIEAAQQITEVMRADQVNVFLYDPGAGELVARGADTTPMGRRLDRLGLRRQALTAGGSASYVFQTGNRVLIRDARVEAGERHDVVEQLGVRSVVAVPLVLDGERCGAMQVWSAMPDWFKADAVGFLEAVARWVGLVAYRAALVDRQIRRRVDGRSQGVAAEEIAKLTPRQREVSRLVARGLSNAQIANELVIAEGTVANHVEQILRRLDYRSRAQVAALFGAVPH